MDNTTNQEYLKGIVSSYQELLYKEPIVFLENPKTDLYKKIKEKILSGNLPWFYSEKTTETSEDILHEPKTSEEYSNTPFFSHSVIERPVSKQPFSRVSSYDVQEYVDCILEILEHNNVPLNVIYRMNINRTLYTGSLLYTMPHIDHDFPHNNLLIYLTEVTGGEIKVYKNKKWHIHKPKEDEIVMFSGLHCHRTAQKPNEHRIAIVTTFI